MSLRLFVSATPCALPAYLGLQVWASEDSTGQLRAMVIHKGITATSPAKITLQLGGVQRSNPARLVLLSAGSNAYAQVWNSCEHM